MELQPLGKFKEQKKYEPLPVHDKPTFLSRLFFTWVHKLIILSPDVRLEKEHTTVLPESEMVENEKLTDQLKRHGLFVAIVYANFKLLSLGIFLETLSILLEFSGPIFIELLIDYFSNDQSSWQDGFYLAASFVVVNMSYPFVDTHRNYYTEIMAMRIRNSLYNVVYTKSLMSVNLPKKTGINLLEVDTEKIYDFFWFSPFILNIPLQIIIAIYFVYSQVGSAVWVAVGTLTLAVLLNTILSSTCKSINEKLMEIRDTRIEHSTQFLTEIRMIKAYSWESYFSLRVQNIRKVELRKLRFLNILNSLNMFYFWSLPSITTVIVIFYYTWVLGQSLNTEKAFVTLTSMYLLQEPLIEAPYIFTHIISFFVSNKRIQELIDCKPYIKLPHSSNTSLKNCTLAYTDKIVLKNINLNINTGEFLCIIGPVGSGKSSLLLSLMGELTLISGKLEVNTDIAYAPSLDSWLLNTTFRENILMGKEFKEDWYWKVINACCLMADINSLPSGDKTEIGERGINLSGGQKARICLARAVYSEKSLYLLDDPLSSVDNKVAEHIFNECFLKLLDGKTRILVTHRHGFLERVDRVVEMRKGEIKSIKIPGQKDEKRKNKGKKSFRGKRRGFRVKGNRKGGKSQKRKENEKDYEEDSEDEEDDEDDEDSEDDSDSDDDDENYEDFDEGKLIEDEDRVVGQVNRSVYIEYFKYSGSFVWIILATFCVMLWVAFEMQGDIFLKNWAEDFTNTEYWLPWFIGFRLGSCLFILISSFLVNAVMSIRISKNAHKKLLNTLAKAPVNLFYDVTPLGRILNRLTNDIDALDEEVPFVIDEVIGDICQCASCVLMGLIYFPYLIAFLPLIFFPAKLVCKYYLRVSRELTRLESISESPILSQFSETLAGTRFIRVFNQSSQFISSNQEKININMRINYSLCGCEQWSRLYLGLLSSFLLCCLFIMSIIFKDSISIGIIGLCLTYMIPLPNDINALLMNVTELENNMVSVERIKTYTDLPQEKPEICLLDESCKNWPEVPSIKFDNVFMRYRPNTELVLKGMNFDILPGKHVGITGRTGSGKSSVFLSLLRIVEIELGNIFIDNVNIAQLGLKKLRQAITLIPQDPLVFNGTMQDNLDPFSIHHVTVLKKVLDEVQLKFGLDFEVQRSGKNLSVGERQLLSLSRALLSKSKIILFDEATAGIDPNTDNIIQKIIKQKFSQCTVLTIAHRLGTIADSDLVLVLSDGKIIEQGPPEVVLEKISVFS
ncbi:hypothetical protein SteCoe_16990 [Stentor coeruleus]|uniref:Uncharacterized protein n=1 Tax=Stentor coeruleus TaxID=5963 RepID=A0A1R2C007_9CILI|nr:hypothetical protein SteCoe_16990 [Stentor coeruleus]